MQRFKYAPILLGRSFDDFLGIAWNVSGLSRLPLLSSLPALACYAICSALRALSDRAPERGKEILAKLCLTLVGAILNRSCWLSVKEQIRQVFDHITF